MEFYQKLQNLRKSKGLTQEELAEILHVSRTAVSKWESDRGYPSIDSLKEISKFFSVTIDELLSCDEVINIAEEENRQNTSHFRDLVFGLLDCCVALFIFLPLFGQQTDGIIREVSLLSLTQIAPWLKISYYFALVAIILCGICTLALQNCQNTLWVKNKSNISLIFSAFGVFLFIISRQAYAAGFLFILLAVKIIILFKKP